jgi:hypothetical protein
MVTIFEYGGIVRYASTTTVSSEKSRGEIEKVLMRYGAEGFMYGWQGASALIAFQINKYHIRLLVPMPKKEDFRLTESGRRERNTDGMLAAWEQATRQRWRALLLIIKAKLECVESGISTLEHEFFGDIVLPNGKTIISELTPQLESAISNGSMPKLLLFHDKK